MASFSSSSSLEASLASSLSTSDGTENILQYPRLDPVTIILSFLEPRDLCTLACLNREWYHVINSDHVWRQAAVDLGVELDHDLEDSGVSWKERVLMGLQWPRVGETLSVQDTYANWSTARVIAKIDNFSVLVFFEGWDYGWNQWTHLVHDRSMVRRMTQANHRAGLGTRGFLTADTYAAARQYFEALLFGAPHQCLWRLLGAKLLHLYQNASNRTLHLQLTPAQRAYAKIAAQCAKPFVQADDPRAWSATWELPPLGASEYLDQAASGLDASTVLQRAPVNGGNESSGLLLEVAAANASVAYPTAEGVGQWAARVVNVSSEFGEGPNSWGSHQLLGPPRVYPRHGDIAQAWAPGTRGTDFEFVEVEFAQPVYATAIHVFETNMPGAITRAALWDATSNAWHTVYQAVSTMGQRAVANILQIPITDAYSRRFTTNRIRLELSQAPVAATWYEIDAIRLFGTQ